MSYKLYLAYFNRFKTEQGYYEACNLLAFKSQWKGRKAYKKLIRDSISDNYNGETKIGADVCCGEYAWLPRHFFNKFSKIYCVDFNSKVFNGTLFKKRKCILINRDVSEKGILPLASLDYIYCGYNLYYSFIDNLYLSLKEGGTMFLMKPKNGDDFFLRKSLKNYNLKKRFKEINNITAFLKKRGTVDYFEKRYTWVFKKPNLDKILAALSVVSLGNPDLLSSKKYDKAIQILSGRIVNEKLFLSQTFSLWLFKKCFF